MAKLKSIPSPRKKILAADEPISPDGSPLVPCLWGIRQDSESICMVRQRGTMELGFTRRYLERPHHRGHAGSDAAVPFRD